MSAINSDRVMEALNALRHLPGDGDNFFAAAALVLSQAQDCPWTIIVPHGDAACQPGGLPALYLGKDGTAAIRASMQAAAWQMIKQNKDGHEHWLDAVDVAGLGRLNARAHLCHDGGGIVRGYLLALTRLPIVDDPFAETFTALMAQRVGAEIHRRSGQENQSAETDNSAQTALDSAKFGLAEVEGTDKSAILEAILDAAPARISFRDTQGRIVFINKTGAEAHGLDPADFLGKTRFEIFGDDAGQITDDMSVQVVRTGKAVFEVEFESRLFPDRIYSYNFAPVFDGQGQVTGVVSTGQDISVRRQAESVLRESEKALSEAQRIGQMGHWRIYPDRGTIELSAQACRLLGFEESDDEHLMSDRYAAVHPEDLVKITNARAIGLANREPYSFQYRMTRPDGEERVMAGEGQPEFDAAGNLVSIFGVTQDITEHRALEAQLAQAQKMETIGQLTGGVAHDFNNILAVIVGNAELLTSVPGNTRGKGKGRNPAEAILRAAERGAELTQRLLAFSRKQPLSPEDIQLDQKIDGMTLMLQRSLGETIKIETISSSGLWPCLIDPGQLENAVLNLAINARDAMPEGGTLSIETGNARLDDIHAMARVDMTPGEYVTLTVTDDGTGMSEQVRNQVFEPFFTTKEQGKGTGLGLSMVFGFVKQSNGHVTVDSKIGRGTTIKLYLPRAEARPKEDAVPQTPSPEAHGECILLVEDDPDVRVLAVDILEFLGYRVLQAQDGAEALEFLKGDEHIDLLFTDVMLPGGMSGDRVARQALDHHPNIKVIYMSGYAHDALVHQGQLQDGVVLLQKPFRQADLAVVLRQVLDEGPLSERAPVTGAAANG